MTIPRTNLRSKRLHRTFSLALALTATNLLVLPGSAQAQMASQPIERHPAPVPHAPEPKPEPPAEADPNADATPLGVDLKSVTVVKNGTSPAGAKGFDTKCSGNLEGLSRQLDHFTGRPLSLKLIAEIKAEIANTCRKAGFPFVHVSTPEQELSGGKLVIRIDEFRVGTAKINGVGDALTARLKDAIRQQPGQPIDAGKLTEDLGWINRYPFRRVEAIFRPGTQPGTSDIDYRVRNGKPWSVGAGYANSGSPGTGMDRPFIYALTALPILPDAWASYQLTTSGPRLADLGNVPSGARRYVSHSVQLSIPTGARMGLELTFDDIQSSQPVESFDIRQHTREWGLLYRSALSNIDAAIPGEIRLGVNWKEQRGKLLFGTTTVSTTAYDVGQVELGYGWHAYDSKGETGLDVALRMSPGGIGSRNSNAVYAAASQGGFTRARYAYASGSLFRRTQFTGFTLTNALVWQYAGTNLPQTEQIGLGGSGQVRGYTADDGTYDRGIVLRNEVRPDPFVIGKSVTRTSMQPFLFLDAGYAGRPRGDPSRIIAAIGSGLDVQIGNRLALSADGGVALARQGNTSVGDARAHIRLTVTY